MKHLSFIWIVAIGSSLSFTSCNTFAGFGRDMAIVGGKLTKTAEGRLFEKSQEDNVSDDYDFSNEEF